MSPHPLLPHDLGAILQTAFLNIEDGEILDPARRAPWLRVLSALDEVLQGILPASRQEDEALLHQLTDGGIPTTIEEDGQVRTIGLQERVSLLLDRYWKLREEMALLRTQKRLHPGATPRTQAKTSTPSDTGLTSILGRIADGMLAEKGLHITFGPLPIVTQLATHLSDLQTTVTENDRAVSAAISSIERTQEADQALLGAQEKRLTEAEEGLACGHDCGGYSCPTLRADWKREEFSCGNGGCPRREA